MDKYQAFLLSLSVLLPTTAGLVRYRIIPASYRPLLLILILGLSVELVSYLFFYNSSNALPSNIYMLCEVLLFILQFRLWGHILQNKTVFTTLISVVSLLWIYDYFVAGSIFSFNLAFQLVYSMLLVLLAVNQLNWLVVNEKGGILGNPIFITCIAVILFFSYKVLTEIFYYYAPPTEVKSNIFVIETFLNVGYNVLLTIAVICIPPKNSFIQLS